MLGRLTHLSDRTLHAHFVATTIDATEGRPAVRAHLEGCARCRERFEQLTQQVQQVCEVASADALEAFDQTRLREQRALIARRLTTAHLPTRVIAFPARTRVANTSWPMGSPVRWVAVAAVVGVLVGAGVANQWPDTAPSGVAVEAVVGPVATGSDIPLVQPDDAAIAIEVDDERFMRELELALARPRTRELQPLDSWTPHVRDIVSRVR